MAGDGEASLRRAAKVRFLPEVRTLVLRPSQSTTPAKCPPGRLTWPLALQNKPLGSPGWPLVLPNRPLGLLRWPLALKNRPLLECAPAHFSDRGSKTAERPPEERADCARWR